MAGTAGGPGRTGLRSGPGKLRGQDRRTRGGGGGSQHPPPGCTPRQPPGPALPLSGPTTLPLLAWVFRLLLTLALDCCTLLTILALTWPPSLCQPQISFLSLSCPSPSCLSPSFLPFSFFLTLPPFPFSFLSSLPSTPGFPRPTMAHSALPLSSPCSDLCSCPSPSPSPLSTPLYALGPFSWSIPVFPSLSLTLLSRALIPFVLLLPQPSVSP